MVASRSRATGKPGHSRARFVTLGTKVQLQSSVAAPFHQPIQCNPIQSAYNCRRSNGASCYILSLSRVRKSGSLLNFSLNLVSQRSNMLAGTTMVSERPPAGCANDSMKR